MPAHLSVNLNAIAMLRNRRDLPLAERDGHRAHRPCLGRAWPDRPSAARPAAHPLFGRSRDPGTDRRRVPAGRVQHRGLSEPKISWRWSRRLSPNRSRSFPTTRRRRRPTTAGTSRARQSVSHPSSRGSEAGHAGLALRRSRSAGSRPRRRPAPTGSNSTRAVRCLSFGSCAGCRRDREAGQGGGPRTRAGAADQRRPRSYGGKPSSFGRTHSALAEVSMATD